MSVWKRNAVVVAIVLFVGAAVYLNWSYGQEVSADGDGQGGGRLLGQAALVNGKEDGQSGDGKTAGDAQSSAQPSADPSAQPSGATSPPPGSTASRPGTAPSSSSSRRRRTRTPSRTSLTRPTPPSRPWRL